MVQKKFFDSFGVINVDEFVLCICYDDRIRGLEEQFDIFKLCFIDKYLDVIEINVLFESLEVVCIKEIDVFFNESDEDGM